MPIWYNTNKISHYKEAAMKIIHTFKSFFILIAVGLLFFQLNEPIFAQQVENVDEAFFEARELAFDGNRDEARELAYAILEISPDYHGVRILIARTYSWDGFYDQAREELAYVLGKTPDHKEALMASIDNEIWAEKPDEAVKIAQEATRHYPVDVSVLLKSASAHYAAEMEREAVHILNRIDQISPSNSRAMELRKSIQISGQNYILTGSYTYDHYSEVFNPSQKGHIQLSRRTPIGSIIGRLNYGNRFDTIGIQPEIDFYPSIADGWYGYMNIGYTNSSIFPEYRAGAELHKRFPRGFELSMGFRYLKFQNSDVLIYTGTITKYQGNWLFTLRPYVTPSSVGFSRSINLLARRYFSGPENYFTFRGGFGFSPEERRFQDVSGDIFFTESQFIGVDLFKSLSINLALFLSFDAARQELSFSPGDYTEIYTFNSGIQLKF